MEQDVRLPEGDPLENAINEQRTKLSGLSAEAPSWLVSYERLLDERNAKAQIESEARLIRTLIDSPDVMRRAGLYDVTLRRVHDGIIETQEEMAKEIQGLKRSVRLVLSAFEALHDIDTSPADSARMERKLRETRELVEQTRRVVSILEDERWDVGMTERLRREEERHGHK